METPPINVLPSVHATARDEQNLAGNLESLVAVGAFLFEHDKEGWIWNTIANKYKMAEPASIKTTYIQVLSLLAKERITYELLWAIFPPNSNVYTKCLVTGAPQCVRYDSCEEREAPLGAESYNIICHYLDSDAGKAWLDITIPKFSGTKSICTLEAFPLLYHPDAEALTTYFVQCGRTFVSIHRPHHCFYPGPMFYMNQGALVEKHITSCVVLDSCGRALGQIEDSDDIDPTELEEKDLCICSPTVSGFALEDELWGQFLVANIEEIQWSSSPFGCLRIPAEDQETITTLARTYGTGEGSGLNITLHGTPGIAKPLIATAVSEYLQTPLISFDAGRLRLDPETWRTQLSNLFRMAKRWNAIILLGQAEIALDSRQARNLVSDFLRQVRVYNGIIFLEVGRQCSPDVDVQSKIALSVRYNKQYTDGNNRTLGDYYQISSFKLESVPGLRESSRSSYQNILIVLAIAIRLWVAQIIAAGGIDLD
ncbi:hypothetical protein ABVK25_010164 [Lepraria finkii]|uniref:DUF7025 domain-containing protein n=1 Tax=Lepraria finkii TaxID=1340010 RepID=A0ABR4AVS2_9LECA